MTHRRRSWVGRGRANRVRYSTGSSLPANAGSFRQWPGTSIELHPVSLTSMPIALRRTSSVARVARHGPVSSTPGGYPARSSCVRHNLNGVPLAPRRPESASVHSRMRRYPRRRVAATASGCRSRCGDRLPPVVHPRDPVRIRRGSGDHGERNAHGRRLVDVPAHLRRSVTARGRHLGRHRFGVGRHRRRTRHQHSPCHVQRCDGAGVPAPAALDALARPDVPHRPGVRAVDLAGGSRTGRVPQVLPQRRDLLLPELAMGGRARHGRGPDRPRVVATSSSLPP